MSFRPNPSVSSESGYETGTPPAGPLPCLNFEESDTALTPNTNMSFQPYPSVSSESGYETGTPPAGQLPCLNFLESDTALTPNTNMSFQPYPPVTSESGYETWTPPAGPLPCLDIEECDTAWSIYSSAPTGDAGMMSPAPQYYDPSYNSPVPDYQYNQHLSDYLQTGAKEQGQLDVIAKRQGP